MLLLAWFRLLVGCDFLWGYESTAADRAAADMRRWDLRLRARGNRICVWETFAPTEADVGWSRRLCQPP